MIKVKTSISLQVTDLLTGESTHYNQLRARRPRWLLHLCRSLQIWLTAWFQRLGSLFTPFKLHFQKSLNDHEWVVTKFSSFLMLKEMNNETSPRPEGGSGGKSWVVRMVERTKSQCHFCQPQNFTVRSLNKYRQLCRLNICRYIA